MVELDDPRKEVEIIRNGRRVFWISTSIALVATFVAVLSLFRDLTDAKVSFTSGEDLGAQGVKIEPIANSEVPHCVTIKGSAKQADGADIWTAHKFEGNQEFVLKKASQISGTDQWLATFRVGDVKDEGKRYEIYAFYVSHDVGNFLLTQRSRSVGGGSSYVYFGSLPPGVEQKPLAIVRRIGPVQACSD